MGRYKVQGFLGSGGYGAVYLASGEQNKLPVAIKILRASANPKQIVKFAQEALLISELRHPHILRVHDFGLQTVPSQNPVHGDSLEYHPFMVTTYANSGNVKQYRPPHQPLPVADTIKIIEQASGALTHVHNHPNRIIHRDVKPENLLLNRRRQNREEHGIHLDVILSDFGAAIVVCNNNSQLLEGSPPYMASEQFTGMPLTQSDLYALGIITFELLTGELPFYISEGGSPQGYGFLHTVMPVPQFKDTIKATSDEDLALRMNLEEVVGKALAKNPDQRFNSVSAYITALQENYTVAREKQRKHRRSFDAVQDPQTTIAAFMRQGKYHEAIQVCKNFPNTTNQYIKGSALLQIKQFYDAYQVFKRLLIGYHQNEEHEKNTMPPLDQLYYGLGLAYVGIGDYETALEQFKSVEQVAIINNTSEQNNLMQKTRLAKYLKGQIDILEILGKKESIQETQQKFERYGLSDLALNDATQRAFIVEL